MKRIILLVALLLCVSFPAFAATAWNTSTLQRFNVANLPRSPSTGMMFYVLDGSSTSDCTTGGGTNKVVCVFNGSTYVGISGGAGGSVATDTIYDAKGDIPIGTGPNASAILSAGSDYAILQSLAGTNDRGMRWLVPVANGTLSCNASLVCQFFTNTSFDDTAALIYSSADSTKKIWFDASQMTTGKTFKLQLSAPTNYTVKVVAQGTMIVTLPTGDVSIPQNPIGGTIGSANTFVKSNGPSTLQASTITEDGTTANFQGLNFISTGMISGGIPVFTEGTTYTIGTNGTSEAYGSMIRLTAASNLVGMPAVPAVGMSGCVFTTLGSAVGASGTIKLDPGTTPWFVANGTAKAAGSRLVSSGATGDYACWVVTAPSTFRIFGTSGTWI